jgi:heterodisulfide reductase subunit B
MPQAKISEIFGKTYNLPVIYFTELIGAAWGAPETPSWLARHLVDPRPCLQH